MKVITGVSDAELNNFDVIEGNDYERVTVEVVRMVSVSELDLCFILLQCDSVLGILRDLSGL